MLQLGICGPFRSAATLEHRRASEKMFEREQNYVSEENNYFVLQLVAHRNQSLAHDYSLSALYDFTPATGVARLA